MNKTSDVVKIIWIISLILPARTLFAHNGTVGYAYPLGKIIVDGDFSDWPENMVTYKLAVTGSGTKPLNESDFSGFFHMGYNAGERSLYLAITITDDDFVEDTSAGVRWDSQDGLELCLDGRHLPLGSGVASFIYTKTLHSTSNAYFDPFARDAKWNMMDVAMVRNGNKRYYEWKIGLAGQFAVGKSIGLDLLAFDMDSDKSFSFNSWGNGERKDANPRSLCDVLLLPADEKLATISGTVGWDKKINTKLPAVIEVINTRDAKKWVTVSVDSMGRYFAGVPAGKYELGFAQAYFPDNNNVYSTVQKKPFTIVATAGKKKNAPVLTISATPQPDLVPDKGVLFGFDNTTAKQVDHFIETYRLYYNIPGVSLALIKDGTLIYYKTYGVKNAFTHEPVDSNTLFEAASITKPVFSFAVQRLAERGIIDLDKPLYLYLPYPDIAYDDRYKLITARHVLTHTTGFPNWRDMNPDGKLDLKFTPGTRFGYSGEGFEYLKMVVEKIIQKKIEQVMQEEVIQPIGLWHTFFSKSDSMRNNVADGHFDGLPNHKELFGSPEMSYSMYTEAKIFTRFMLYLLEQKGLSAKTYAEMFSKHVDFDDSPNGKKPGYTAYMGESLEIRETPFGKSFGHGGDNGDFKCKFRVYKDLKMGYVLFTNSNTSDPLLNALGQFFVEGKDK